VNADFQRLLVERADLAGVPLPKELAERLGHYYALLTVWNQKINLTGMDLSTLSPAAIDRLLIEPVVAARYAADGASVIDIGSGGGSPAIPFALAMRASALVMVESKERKSVFLREAARAAGLGSAKVLTARFEDVVAGDVYDVLTVRAVRIDTAELTLLQQFLRPGGRLLLFHSSSQLSVEFPEPLLLTGTYSLVSSLSSSLTIAEKTRSTAR
jgi:16S rRNA (guanine527-N7)-methyltransferase